MIQHDYLRILTEQIRCERARTMIAEEIQGHIEEQKLDFMAEGMTEQEAEEAAVREMGDPVDVGVQLDRIHRPKMDKPLIGVMIGLSSMGAMIQILLAKYFELAGAAGVPYSASEITVNLLEWTGIGLILLLILYYVDYTVLGRYALWIWGVLAAGVVGYRMFGNIINGGLPKMSLLICLMVPAYAGVVYHYRGKGKSGLGKSILFLVLSVAVFLCVSQLNRTNSAFALVMGVTGSVVLFAAIGKCWFGKEGKKQTVAVLFLLVIIPLVFSVVFLLRRQPLAEYQLARIETLSHPKDSFAWQQMEQLFHNVGNQPEMGNLPENADMCYEWVRSDYLWIFIFKAMGSAVGIVCVAMLVWLFFWLFRLVHRQKNQLGYIISLGCVTMMLLQTLLYAAVNLGIVLPASVYMPFFTYGGSNIVITYLYMGLFLSISRNERIVPAK